MYLSKQMGKASSCQLLLPEGVEWVHLEDQLGPDNTIGWDVLRSTDMENWDHFDLHSDQSRARNYGCIMEEIGGKGA